MSLVTKQIPLLLSSAVENGAINKTDDGSEFTASLDNEDIFVPSEAINCSLFVQDAEYSFTFPNIRPGVNNTIRINYDDGINPVFVMDIEIPKGLYGISELDYELQYLMLNYPNYPESEPLFSLIGQVATQKTNILFNYSGVSIDFTSSDSLADILGFNRAILPLGGSVAGITLVGERIAQFNTLKYILISCDLCDNGFANNNTYDFYVCRSLIDGSPGSQILYQPQIKYKVPATNLVGKKLSRTRVKLLDDKGKDIDTNEEDYSIQVIIEYQIFADV